MSSAKSDKILQESEKILTNPVETGRICPIFPGGQGAMRLGLSSCSDRRDCTYMQSLHLMISSQLQRAQRLCIYTIQSLHLMISSQLQWPQRLCIYAIPAPDDLIAVAASAGNVQHSVSGALHSYEKKRPRRDAFKNRSYFQETICPFALMTSITSSTYFSHSSSLPASTMTRITGSVPDSRTRILPSWPSSSATF